MIDVKELGCLSNLDCMNKMDERITALEEGGGGGGDNGWVVSTSNALSDYVENGVFKQDFLIEVYRPLQYEDHHVRKLIPFYKGLSVADYGKADTYHRGQASENGLTIDMTTYIITTVNNVLGVNIFGTTAEFVSENISTGDLVSHVTMEFRIWVKA